MTVYCVRHGQTDWNAQSRYQGQMDVPLNDSGREQALRNGQALRGLLPAIADVQFVSSPLWRARETMQIVRRELGLEPLDFRTDERLKEVNYGAWEGQLLDTLKKTEASGLAARKADPYNFRPPDGESYADLMKRMVDWLDTVEADTIVATHGGISRTLRAHLLDLNPSGILDLAVPQDRVLVIRRGEMRWM
ncbi:MAG: histidine phosphatase family protein [Alphaproteobacteria bacterium]|nr:histidine phosphatase family protein [Alphaproteobacteria bacterium]